MWAFLNKPSLAASFPVLHPMKEAHSVSETSYKSNLSEIVGSMQHNFVMKLCVVLLHWCGLFCSVIAI
jgi:hypothetical protein